MDQGKTLLIVDDEVDVCLLLSKFLKRRYHQVECAHTLTEALQKAAHLHPDLILLDNNLPDGYGIEHISDFKSVHDSCRLIMISAMANLQQEALDAGADLFLEKPIVLNSLLEVT
jgi:DNA-binding response OmpR family regulator